MVVFLVGDDGFGVICAVEFVGFLIGFEGLGVVRRAGGLVRAVVTVRRVVDESKVIGFFVVGRGVKAGTR